MNNVNYLFCSLVLGAALTACASLRAPRVDVLTQRYDLYRSALNLNENQLSPQSVAVDRFGKLFERKVQGAIYAQPLIVSEVEISANGRRDVVYLATMNNQVTAFDAKDPDADQAIWGPISLGPAIELPDPCIANRRYRDIAGRIGIMSTPVIDRDSHSLYVVSLAKTVAGTNPDVFNYGYTLTRLDIRNGWILKQSSIANTVNHTEKGCTPIMEQSTGPRGFQSNRQDQRPGLLLMDDTIYVAFASFGDQYPFHGWILSFDSTA
ncbi:MAG: hypothetical protein ACRERS_07905, partial [Methylococcales bacterium]